MDVRVWVGCLAHYNNGELIGDWVSAVDAPDWVCPKRNPADIYINCEETWCMDQEIPGVEGELSPVTAREWGEVFAQLSEEDVEPFGVWVSYHGYQRSPSVLSLEHFRESYQGKFDSERDFAYHFAEECLEMDSWPKVAQDYFDYDAYARDLFMGDFYFDHGHVFDGSV